jgi:hypothetical protein
MSGPDDPPPGPRSLEWRDVREWRKRVRESLISRRLALDGALRESRGKQTLQRLLERVELARYPWDTAPATTTAGSPLGSGASG